MNVVTVVVLVFVMTKDTVIVKEENSVAMEYVVQVNVWMNVVSVEVLVSILQILVIVTDRH